MRLRRFMCAGLVLAALVPLTSCGGSDKAAGKGGEVVITCTSCASSSTDAFQKYRNQLTERFNQKYAGKYRIQVEPTVGEGDEDQAKEGYRRLALAHNLPDLFIAPGGLVDELRKSAKLEDFEPKFKKDTSFANTFYDGILRPDDQGQLLLVPEERSIAGVYYNTDVLHKAGISAPPQTWDQFQSMATAVKADGETPMAVDGLWVTLLWLTHLIGTQDGGADYLNQLLVDGVTKDVDLTSDQRWVQAVETLRQLHSDGDVNQDAYTGDFQRADAVYETGDAATIANGPWQTDLIKNPKVLAATTSVPAPGDGLIVFSGGGGWASAAQSAAKQEAVWAFIKFAYGWDEQVKRTIATSSYPAVQGDFSEADKSELNAANANLMEASKDVTNTYPALALVLPDKFQDAWRNYWPAYVQGDESTGKFLGQLNDAIH
jgi:raffinose/stachyose/melibiose transport system substrate-binding protein